MTQVDLSHYDNSWYRPGRSVLWRSAWHFVGLPLLRCSLITSSSFRAGLLRVFGAVVGSGVVMRHGINVKYPWHLSVGDCCWFGEDCWLDSLTSITLGNNVCISQGAYLCTGNHDWSDPAFGLIVSSIRLEDGAWAGAKCILAPGAVLGRGAVAGAGSVITGEVPDGAVFTGNPATFLKTRVVSCRNLACQERETASMRILFLNQFFWPDSSATSQLLTDLARGLAERGHEVSVICADGGYAPAEISSPPPVNITRVKALPFGRGTAGRVLSYLSFYVQALWRSFRGPRPDMVVSLTTPPLISLVGSLVKLVRGTQHFIWEMDVYPDVAVDLQYFKRGGIADRVVGLLGDTARKHADGILALGVCMKERLLQRGVAADRIFIAENWADSSAIVPQPRTAGDPNQLVLLYSGNLGLAHDTDTILGAIKRLKEDARFRFLFVGGGARRAEVSAFCEREHIESVELRSYVARGSLGDSLSVGDIGLVTQKDVCCGSVVPSKVYGILAAGRPVLFIGPRDATPAVTITHYGCGWQVDCGDVEAVTKLLLHLADHPEEIETAGRLAREALLTRFDLPIGVSRIAHVLESEHRLLNTRRGYLFTRSTNEPTEPA